MTRVNRRFWHIFSVCRVVCRGSSEGHKPTLNGRRPDWCCRPEAYLSTLETIPRLLDPVWNMFDLLPEGRGDFEPKLSYQARRPRRH